MKNDFTFKKRKYGLFVHFVHGISCRTDGSLPKTVDETVNDFDANAFADLVSSMGVEYLIFTAWHWRAIPLYPSAVTKKYRGDICPRRDLLGEIIDAVTARGIDMILYTHPRDGHDFSPEDMESCGWGRNENASSSTPAKDLFDYKKWNAYTLELYSELLERYGDKLSGIYTDGTGPYSKKSERYESTLQVVDYTMLRNIIKSADPSLFMIQNHFGYLFSDDFEMPEGYFHFETDNIRDTSVIPAARKALAFCPFEGNWWPLEKTPRGKDVRKTSSAELARFAIFNASCTAGGGICFASGPYCCGSLFPVGVAEQMNELGKILRERQDTVLDAFPSRSYPTVSGDTMRDKDFICFTESEDGKYEYLHILKPQAEIVIPRSADGALLSCPTSLCDTLAIESFENGVLSLSGEFDEIDSVIRFERHEPQKHTECEWINDSDKRLRYDGAWRYTHLRQNAETHTALGSYESDFHVSSAKGDTVFTYFDGSIVEIYGNKRQANGGALVYIDGVFAGELYEHSEIPENRSLLFSSINLYGGTHTLYIVTESDAPFELDAIKIIC